MFESIRNNTRIMALLLGVVVVPAFVLVGINGYTRYSERSEAVAQVGSQTITQEQWDQAHQAEIARQQRNVPNLDLKLLDTPQARHATLERLVHELILTKARDDQLLTVSDQRLAQALVQDPVIAGLRDAQGRLDSARYRDVLAAQGFTPQSYEASVRADLSTAQVTDAVASSALLPAALAQPILDGFFQRRSVALRHFAASDFQAQIQVKDDEVRAYYDQNPARFQAPETVDLSYVVLDQAALAKDIRVDEADLRVHYEQNKRLFSTPERRRVRHILIAAQGDAAAQQAAQVQAQALLAQVKAAPQDFAAIAKKSSADPGSAEQGGDLGWVDRGAMVKAFEDAAYALPAQAISDLVKTEFGWHIIQATEVQAATAQPYEQLRDRLLNEVQAGKARARFAEMVEPFSNAVYEQAQGFDAVAKKFNLQIHTQAGLTRQGGAGVLSNARLLAAIFSPESLRNKTNTDAIEVDRNQLVAARVTAHAPAHTRDFAAVKDQARQALLAQRSVDAAKAAGEKALRDAQASGQATGLLPPVTLARDQSAGVSALVVQKVLQADASKLPQWLGVDLAAQGYTLVRLDAVSLRPAPGAEVAQQERSQLLRSYASAEVQAYVAHLRAHYKARILAPKPKAQLAKG